MSQASRDRLLRQAAAAKAAAEVPSGVVREAAGATEQGRRVPRLEHPLGLRVRDPKVRRREAAVRRLLEQGVLRTGAIVDAFLEVSPDDHLSPEEAEGLLADRIPRVGTGAPPPYVGITLCGLAMEAMRPVAGDRVADLLAARGYVSALLAQLVGAEGRVTALYPGSFLKKLRIGRRVTGQAPDGNVQVVHGIATTARGLEGPFDALWFGAVLPRVPEAFGRLLGEGGRCVALVGPRFGVQDLVCVSRGGQAFRESVLTTTTRGVAVAGPTGWLRGSADVRP